MWIPRCNFVSKRAFQDFRLPVASGIPLVTRRLPRATAPRGRAVQEPARRHLNLRLLAFGCLTSAFSVLWHGWPRCRLVKDDLDLGHELALRELFASRDRNDAVSESLRPAKGSPLA